MSSGTKVTREVGAQVAHKMLAAIGDCCTRVAVAGSLRRGKHLVGDVELVVQPAFDFGVNLLEQRVDQLFNQGVITKRHAWGPRLKTAVYYLDKRVAVNVDLFIVLPDRQWGPTFWLRTGPDAANRCAVTPYMQRTTLGDLGVRPHNIFLKDGAWRNDRNEIVDTPEEIDVFRLLGIPWVPPHLRTPEAYLQAVKRADHWYGKQMLKQSRSAWIGCAQMPKRDSVWWPMKNGKVVVTESPHHLATGKTIEVRQEALI